MTRQVCILYDSIDDSNVNAEHLGKFTLEHQGSGLLSSNLLEQVDVLSLYGDTTATLNAVDFIHTGSSAIIVSIQKSLAHIM